MRSEEVGHAQRNHAGMSTGRLEAFSDGVLAVAATLLVLSITFPQPGPHVRLGHELAGRWPTYAAYVTSFITIGIIWINHHAMISRLRIADHAILMLNLLLLLTIGLIPFGTALVAAYLTAGRNQHLAAAIYSGIFLAMALAFTGLNYNILIKKPHMLRYELGEALRRRILARSASGILPYAIATALAPVSPYMTLAITAGLAAFYSLPLASSVDAVSSP
jgi:uncharacterized membrane protein